VVNEGFESIVAGEVSAASEGVEGKVTRRRRKFKTAPGHLIDSR